MKTILNVTEAEREDIYVATRMLDRVMKKYPGERLQTVINDLENDSLIFLSYRNNAYDPPPPQEK